MTNNWLKIWNNRKTSLSDIDKNDEVQLIAELKKISGWDFFGNGSEIMVEEFKREYLNLKENLRLTAPPPPHTYSVFEVGCGSGTYLYLFKKEGFSVGGLDYAENALTVARNVIGRENFIECIFAEADKLPTEVKYDAVFSNSVFQYFDSLDYAEKVLDRMLLKTNKSVAVLEIFNEEMKEEYLEFRRKEDQNYDEHYKGLPKLFISQGFFKEYAEKNNLELKFDNFALKNYWNAQFIFNCYLYKK